MSSPTAKSRQHFTKSFILVIIAVFGLNVGQAIIDTPRAVAAEPYQYLKVAPENSKVFEAAASQYFATNATFHKAPCKPKNIKIAYYDGSKGQGHEDAFAYVDTLLSGFKKIPSSISSYTGTEEEWKQDVIDFRNDPNPSLAKWRVNAIKTPGYCTIHWNTAEWTRRDAGAQCRTFVHEYGHMLGRIHTDDAHSVMYVGYAKDDHSHRATRETNIERIAAKTVCPGKDALRDKHEAVQKKKDERKKKLDAKAEAKRKKAAAKALKKKQDNATLTEGQKAGMCVKVANAKKIKGKDEYVPHNAPKDVSWRKKLCREGVRKGLIDYRKNKKTPKACYAYDKKNKRERTDWAEEVCNLGRYAAIERLNEIYGRRNVR